MKREEVIEHLRGGLNALPTGAYVFGNDRTIVHIATRQRRRPLVFREQLGLVFRPETEALIVQTARGGRIRNQLRWDDITDVLVGEPEPARPGLLHG